METITGFVEHIVYRNEENGYTVLNLASNEEDEVTCVGVFQMISEGESLELTGEYTVHPSYGPQFKVQQYSIKAPEDIASIERYLGSRRTSPQKIHLREPNEGDREQVMAYREEFLAIGSRMDGTSALDKYADFDAWLAQLRKLKDPATTPAGLVPATEYLALDEHEHLVGMTNLRHRLNDYLLTYGGHIGYSVRPSERQNGYATQMLRLTLEKAKERGIEKVRICCDHYNVASAKTIRANGGVLEDEQFDSSDGTLTQRYWIQNK